GARGPSDRICFKPLKGSPTMLNTQSPLVLVTGATGYIGGRIVPRLLSAGYRVRCLVRDASRVQGRPWRDDVELIEGDVLQPETLAAAVSDVAVAYYLVHSLGAGSDFPERDVQAAESFGVAAREAGVGRIIYLGGLGDPRTQLSAHLRSRHDTGDALRKSSVPVTEFRAGVIVGSGSLSFEMIRYLAERVPVMICPRWVYTPVQPIAIRNVLDYLIAALSVPASTGEIVEIGGADVVTYGEMLTIYAEVRGLRRWLLPVPVLTPRLSSWWVHFITPIPAAIARPLIDGLQNEVVVRDNRARQLFPTIDLLDYRTAVKFALDKLNSGAVETAWSDALSATWRSTPPVTLTTREGMILEHRQMIVDAPAELIFRAFTSLGGTRGWLYMNWAWRVRGAVDRIVGGVGLRRGRRDAKDVRVGDALDFWRVEAIEAGRLIRLRAEMKVPGKAWLEFEVRPESGDLRSLLSQTAVFAPKGISGLAYWYLLYPVHALIFRGLIRRISSLAGAT
ncbi:MAG TPA: SDR family oxidoreductase, partial [Chthoniobacterales bacterium]